jgi:hypothetical protein
MKPDYLTLSNGRVIRIEWNMNALAELSTHTGIEISDLTSAKADIKMLRAMAWLSAKEGESIDGKELNMTELEFGRLMSMKSIIEFSEILTKQTGGQKKSPYQEKKPLIFFRKKG